jgi:hypothetical protein
MKIQSKKAHGVALMVVAVMGILFFFIFQSHYTEAEFELWIGESQNSLIGAYYYPDLANNYVASSVKYSAYELLYDSGVDDSTCNANLMYTTLSSNFVNESNIDDYLSKYILHIEGIEISIPQYKYEFKQQTDDVMIINYGYIGQCSDKTPAPTRDCINSFIKSECDKSGTCYVDGTCDSVPGCAWEGDETDGFCKDVTSYPVYDGVVTTCLSFNETECISAVDNKGGSACQFEEQFYDNIRAFSPQLFEYQFSVYSDAYFEQIINCESYKEYYAVRKTVTYTPLSTTTGTGSGSSPGTTTGGSGTTGTGSVTNNPPECKFMPYSTGENHISSYHGAGLYDIAFQIEYSDLDGDAATSIELKLDNINYAWIDQQTDTYHFEIKDFDISTASNTEYSVVCSDGTDSIEVDGGDSII